MSKLLTLEQDFKDCMLANQVDMGGHVVGTARASAEERVKVYVEGYRLRLLEVLQDNFTGLHGLLGDAQFDEMGRAYIDAHPSTHPSVRWFGRQLAGFLRDIAPYSAHPHLAEMAAFEWAQGLVFDSADIASLDMQALAAVPPEDWARVGFGFHPSVQRLDLAWNVPKLWQALEAEETPPEPDASKPGSWLLWRKDLTTHWRSLGPDEAWMLDAARGGRRFGELCEGLCEWHAADSVALQAASYLKLWLSDGLVTAVVLD
ncbi:MAG TPA: DNA-binding domain-containing protein [Gammaproteobacteria bacterium]